MKHGPLECALQARGCRRESVLPSVYNMYKGQDENQLARGGDEERTPTEVMEINSTDQWHVLVT